MSHPLFRDNGSHEHLIFLEKPDKMRLIRTICLSLLLVAGLPWAGHAAAVVEAAAKSAEVAGKTEAPEGLPLYSVEIARIGPLPITNSMVVTWVVALALILFARISMRKMAEVPSGSQNLCEWLVESLFGFLEGIIGHALAKKTFWFFATIFLFILFLNWFGLIPGVGTVGWGHATEHGFHLTRPWLRGANADLNMTLAMSMVFFACWIVWALQTNGIGGFIKHIFGAKGDTAGAMKVLMFVVFLAVGLLEVVSILFRPVSLSFRLYGNVYAGENMLEAMAHIVPSLSWIIPIPFYFLEILVGLVQALVFMLLTAVFTLLICQHDESHGEVHH